MLPAPSRAFGSERDDEVYPILNDPVTLKIRRIARRVLPTHVRILLHRILRDEALITVRYGKLMHWPEEDHAGSWRAARMSRGVIKELAAFKLKLAKHSPKRAFSEPIVQDNLKLLSKVPLKEANFLDFGCGNGIYYYILTSYPATREWKYTGAEANPELIRFCKSMLPNLRFEELQGNGKLPFGDQEFDAVLASGVVQYVRDYATVLQELLRISKRYVVVSRLPLWEENSIILIQHFRHRKDTVEQHLALHLLNRQEFERQLKQLGFKVLHVEKGSEFLILPDTSESVSCYGYLLQKEAGR